MDVLEEKNRLEKWGNPIKMHSKDWKNHPVYFQKYILNIPRQFQ